jgi:FtsH-binding integral membrane protein
MLALRSALTFTLLLLVAAIYKLAGSQDAIAASSAWWLWFVTIANFACIILMVHFARKEGLRLKEIYFANRSSWKGDLLWFLIFSAVTAVVAMPPGTLLAGLLWGDPNFPNAMLFQPIPELAIFPLFVLMPVSQALAELPIYWGYVGPRLQAAGMNRWLVILLVGMVLSVQHMFFTFQLDWRFDLWLAIKFLPFALWTGIVIDRRPTALPYLMAVHFLIDATLPLLLLFAAKGLPLGM